MKKAIKLSVLFLLASTGLFAAPAKPASPKATSIKNMVSFSTLPSRRGIEIKVKNDPAGKATVIIYNWNNDVVWKDALSQKKGMDRAFNLSQLDNGNYTVEVLLNKQMVKKTAHVYYRGDTKFVQLKG